MHCGSLPPRRTGSILRLLRVLPLSLVTCRPATAIYTLSLHDALPIFALLRHQSGGVHELGIAERGLIAAFRQDGHSDRKSTRLNSSHVSISYAVFCLKKKKNRLKEEMLDSTTHDESDRIRAGTSHSHE